MTGLWREAWGERACGGMPHGLPPREAAIRLDRADAAALVCKRAPQKIVPDGPGALGLAWQPPALVRPGTCRQKRSPYPFV